MWTYIIIGYLFIGFSTGMRKIRNGTYGTTGPFVSLIVFMLLWPFI